jgi:phage gpG-like protein
MKPISTLIAEMKAAKEAMKKLESQIPRIIGNEAVKVIKDNFRLQGYDSGSGVTKWMPRSPETNYRYNKRYGVKGSVYQATNPILKQTGVLYNSVQYKVQGKLVFVGVDLGLVPYAQKMNDGGRGKWGKNTTFTPKRKYMPSNNEPPNAKMLKKIIKKIGAERDRALAPFKK